MLLAMHVGNAFPCTFGANAVAHKSAGCGVRTRAQLHAVALEHPCSLNHSGKLAPTFSTTFAITLHTKMALYSRACRHGLRAIPVDFGIGSVCVRHTSVSCSIDFVFYTSSARLSFRPGKKPVRVGMFSKHVQYILVYPR